MQDVISNLNTNCISFTMNSIQQENSAISDSSSFQWSLISYALHPQRIFFIDNHEIWKDFHQANKVNFENYSDLTPEQLCEHFLNKVLPQIENYDLIESELMLLNLLALHPAYRRTENGYVKTDDMEKIQFHHELDAKGQTNRNLEAKAVLNLDIGNYSDLEKQVIIQPRGAIYPIPDDYQMAKENATLLSVALCPPADLPACELLTLPEMLKRLREAKLKFQQRGQQLENVKCTIQKLLENLQTVCELKDTIDKLVQGQM